MLQYNIMEIILLAALGLGEKSEYGTRQATKRFHAEEQAYNQSHT
jgi:hypothetical protein